MSVMMQIVEWRKARPMKRSAKVALPDGSVAHIWELENADANTGIGVIEKKGPGEFLSFHVEGKSFGVVTGVYKRRAAKMKKGARNGSLI